MHQSYRDKIVTLDQLLTRSKEWKQDGATIIFTNGCFDILHLGHIEYLEQAARLGDVLVVGLNSQGSVNRIKGPFRPIQDEQSRAAVLSSLGCIDAVCIFEQDTPEDLIRALTPDVLVKGGDWLPEQIIGADWVTGHGGKVISIPYVPGYSTTRIEQKIKNLS